MFVEIEASDHTPEWRAEFRKVIPQFPSIVEVHRMAGDIDYMLKVVVPDMGAFDGFYLEFTRRLPCRNITSKFSMEVILASTAWPIDTETA